MIQFRRIMLPTDFSEYSQAATAYAVELAEKFDAELHLFHVVEVHPGSTPVFGGGLALAPNVKESREHAVRQLAGFLDPQWRNAHKVVHATGDGPPFLEIIRYAKENDIDLIIIGTHGRTGLAHVMIGSVAEKVVRKAPCPVLTVRAKGHQFVMP